MVEHEQTFPHSIKQNSDQFRIEEGAEAFKTRVIEPSKTAYKEYEYDELVYRDFGLSHIPKEVFAKWHEVLSLREVEAAFWMSLSPTQVGNEYIGISELCNVENKVSLKILCSADGKLLGHLFSPEQRATIRQFSKNEGNPSTVNNLINPRKEGGI
jgi:hypothetical protein